MITRRYVILTDKGIYAYTGNDKDSECTMDLMLSECSDLREATEDNMYCIVNTYITSSIAFHEQ